MDLKKFTTILANIENDEEIWEIIKKLYTRGHTYKSITSLFQKVYKDCDIQDIIEVLQYYDIKKCSSGDNCKSFNGEFQSRSSFANNSTYPDGLNPTCKECKSYYCVYKKASQEKKNQIDYFRSLKTVEERENYIYELYVIQEYTMQDIKTITLFAFQDVVDLIVNKFQIQRCANGKTCVNKEGSLQKIDEFGRDRSRPTGFSTICLSCVKVKQRSSNYKQSHKKTLQKFANFDTFASKIYYAEEIRRDPEHSELLQVKCYNHKCGKWFNPTTLQVRNRIMSLNGLARSITTACSFYCTQECKDSCPSFGIKAKDLISSNNSEDYQRMQAEVRKFKIEVEGEPDHCDICGVFANLSDLILHHKYPVATDHIFEADLDNLIWVCKGCHSNAHHKDGCGYYELSEMKNAC